MNFFKPKRFAGDNSLTAYAQAASPCRGFAQKYLIAKMFDRFCLISKRLGRVLTHYARITLKIVPSDKSLARGALVPLRQRSHLQIASISVAPVQTMLFRLGLDHEL
jgi:hypothetical protein